VLDHVHPGTLAKTAQALEAEAAQLEGLKPRAQVVRHVDDRLPPARSLPRSCWWKVSAQTTRLPITHSSDIAGQQ
jgi:hypothetical protein